MNICLIGSWVKRYIAGEGSLWKRIVDSKYNTRNPNILCCQDSHPSQFWKSFQWALQAMKLGYKWHVGNGRMVRFWEDTWHGNAPLATQCWDLYYLVHEKNKIIVELWDGTELKYTFRRVFPDDLMIQWLDLVNILRLTQFSDDDDSLIWQYDTKGGYSSKSLYAIVNFRGVQPLYLLVVWSINRYGIGR